jgi:hypothetical protein
MAKNVTCDLCGEEAIDLVEVKSGKTTPIKLDVCQEHLREFKKLMRHFTKQELTADVEEILKKDAKPE